MNVVPNDHHLKVERDKLRVLIVRAQRRLAEVDAAIQRRPNVKRSRKVVPECGTESAYQRHRHYGDTSTDDRRVTCQPCLEGHAAHNRMKAAS